MTFSASSSDKSSSSLSSDSSVKLSVVSCVLLSSERDLFFFSVCSFTSLVVISLTVLIGLMSYDAVKPKLDDKFVNPSTYPVDAAKYIKENLDVNSIKLSIKG